MQLTTPVGRAGATRDVQAFVDSLKEADSLRQVHALLGDFTDAVGIRYFALLQHRAVDRGPPIQLANYPDSWIEALLERRLLADDPVLVMAQRSAAPFDWCDLERRWRLSEAQRNTLIAAKAHGIGDGFTVPLHIPGEPLGLCSFAQRPGEAFPALSKPLAQYAACFAFEAARRLATRARPHDPPRLTQRQLDCLVLLAQGKSESVAGQLLGLSPRTVHKYMEHAKSRYDVASKPQLIVRALFDGALTFADIL